MSHWHHVRIHPLRELKNTPDSFGIDFITNFGAPLSFKEIKTTILRLWLKNDVSVTPYSQSYSIQIYILNHVLYNVFVSC